MKRKTRTDILRNLIDQSDLSLEQVANGAGIGKSTLVKIMNGSYPPSVDCMWALADYFAVPIDFLVGRLSKEETDKIQEDFVQNWRLLQKGTYEESILSRKVRGRKPIPDGYEAPWPYNLLEDIYQDSFTWVLTDDQMDGLKAAITALSTKEYWTIFGIYYDHHTLAEIGKELNVTNVRVQQLHHRAVQKLRAPVNLHLIEDGLKGSKELREEECYISKKRMEIMKAKIELQILENEPVYENDPFKRPFEEIIWPSVRTFNCLKRAHINTISDILDAFQDGRIMKIRNLGRKSIEELTRLLNDLGLTLYDNCDGTWTLRCELKEVQLND